MSGRHHEVSTAHLHRAVVAVGLCLLVVSLLNLTLVWMDVDFGSPQWELAVTSQTLERVPVLMLSLVLAAVGAVVGGTGWAVRTLAVAFLVLALAIAGLAGLYGLGVLQTYNTMPQAALLLFKASAVKNAVATLVMFGTSTFVGVLLWTRVQGRSRRGDVPLARVREHESAAGPKDQPGEGRQ